MELCVEVRMVVAVEVAAERAHVCELSADVASSPVDLDELALQVPPFCGQVQELPLRVIGL